MRKKKESGAPTSNIIGGAPRLWMVKILKARADEVRSTEMGSLPTDIETWADTVPDAVIKKLTLDLIKDYFLMGRFRRAVQARFGKPT